MTARMARSHPASWVYPEVPARRRAARSTLPRDPFSSSYHHRDALELVAHERGRGHDQDRHREPLLHRGRARAPRPRRGVESTGPSRPVAGGNGRGPLLHLHQTPVSCPRPRRGSPDSSACSRPTRRSTSSRPAPVSHTAWQAPSASCRKSGTPSSWSAPRSSPTSGQRADVAHGLRRRGRRPVVAPAPAGVAANMDVPQPTSAAPRAR